jgi:hypothetical protein
MNNRVKDYLEQLNLIYYAFIGLPLILFPMVYLPLKDELVTDTMFQDLISFPYFAAVLLLFLTVYFARRLFRSNLLVISEDWTFSKKLRCYRKISIVFYSFGLISGLVSVGLLMFTRHQLFVASYPILLLIMSLYRPTIERLKRELPFTNKDLRMISEQVEITDNIEEHNR